MFRGRQTSSASSKMMSMMTNNKTCSSSISSLPRLFTSSRFCSASASATKNNNNNNPVDVENWTLNKEIVKRHQEIQEKWLSLAESFKSLKESSDHQGIVQKVDEGFKLLQEVGAEDSPVQCAQMLYMTKAQAHLNNNEFDAAYDSAKKARDGYSAGGSEDAAAEGNIREAYQFLGFVELERKNFKQALDIFEELLVWCAEGSRKSLPMVQVLAVNMKRTLQTGKARALYGLSQSPQTDNGSELLNESLDLSIESLSAHVDEKDVESAKSALDNALLCYCALGDLSKAEDACNKLLGWCKRNDDESGVTLAKSRRQEIEELKNAKK